MGFLDLYRFKKPEEPDIDGIEEEPLEPLPKISRDELWPPSPRVRILYIGIAFGALNFLLLCIWVIVMIRQFG